MPVCDECGSFVTTQFVRVFGNNHAEVHGCPNCVAFRELASGAVGRGDT